MPSHMSPVEKPSPKGGKGPLIAVIVLVVVVVLLGGAYVAGALAFNQYFMPGTTLDGEDVSMRTVSDVAAEKSRELDDYQLHVSGNGIDLTITPADIDLTCDGEAYAQSAIDSVNTWAWPLEIAQQRNLTSEASISYDREKIAALIEPVVEQGKQAVDATGGMGISYDAEQGTFKLADGVIAQHINVDAVVERIAQAIEARETELTLGAETLDVGDSIENAVTKANSYLSAIPTLNLAGEEVYDLTSEMVAGWVVIGDDMSVSLNQDAITEWCKGELSDLTDTAGTERTYTRPDGKTFTVSDSMTNVYGRSSYGWIIDGAATAEQIVTALESGTATAIDIPTIQTAAQINPGGQDWGERYIDVDLTEQHARYYDNGKLIWEADITSGMPGQGTGGETPTGVWTVDSVKSAATDGDINLKGPIDPATGQPEWDSHVDFWVGFVGNGGSRNGNLIGFHNAPWQYQPFGGDTYLYNGSHGCVRLSYDSGQALYKVAQKGDAVVVHK